MIIHKHHLCLPESKVLRASLEPTDRCRPGLVTFLLNRAVLAPPQRSFHLLA